MKNLFFILSVMLLFSSCENLEDNSPALQGTVDHVVFKAVYARAIANVDGSYTIEGNNEVEEMTLHISSPEIGTYYIGEGFPNSATFETINGVIYSTSSAGEGKIIVSNWDTSINAISGTFNFSAAIPGVDTITVNNGVFYEVPYIGGSGETNDGTLTANVDGNGFNAINVTTDDTGNSIIITAIFNAETIKIVIPIDAAVGNYVLPLSGYLASYSNGAGFEQAESGVIDITLHDVGVKTVKGTFSFETSVNTITSGQFNVTY